MSTQDRITGSPSGGPTSITGNAPPHSGAGGDVASHTAGQQLLFWGCFIALVTTAFGFIARMFLINTWAAEFGLDPAQSGRLAGIGIWPFAVSIIGFSLVIDKIGYKIAMVFAFLGHIIWAVMGYYAYQISHDATGAVVKDASALATAYSLLYWGSLILALANGTVEAFINPVVATMFYRDKTKWLNILHAGWPGGLVVAGIITIYMGNLAWGYKVSILGIPAVIYFVVLITRTFPVQEREAAGVSYKDMLSEFGVLGATVVGFLITLQLMDFFSGVPMLCIDNDPTQGLSTMAKGGFIGVGVLIVLGFGLYTQSLGRPLLFLLVLIMMPLATTEIGTDGWITGIMESVTAGKFHPGWILVFTSVIMMVLRFFAGPIVHLFSPLGLLAISSVLAIAGLAALSVSGQLAMIFLAAFLYGLGKTFFWPTMLGVVAEQTPKGGALTLNAISGIGMLAVGTLGLTYIGTLKSDKEIHAVAASSAEVTSAVPGFVKDGQVQWLEGRKIYEILPYKVIDDKKLKAEAIKVAEPKRAEVKNKLQKDAGDEWAKHDAKKQQELIEGAMADEIIKPIAEVRERSSQGALLNMTLFPGVMLLGYLGLLAYFRAKGGYKAVVLADH